MIANFFIDIAISLLGALVNILPQASASFVLPLQTVADNAALAFGYIPLIENVPILVFALQSVIAWETAKIAFLAGNWVYRKFRSG